MLGIFQEQNPVDHKEEKFGNAKQIGQSGLLSRQNIGVQCYRPPKTQRTEEDQSLGEQKKPQVAGPIYVQSCQI